MSLADLIARQMAMTNRKYGTEVTLGGRSYWVTKTTVADGKAGLQFLSRMGLGTYAARADASLFEFAPDDFRGGNDPPSEEDILTWQGRGYILRNVTDQPMGRRDVNIMAYGHRVLMSDDADLSPVFDTETVTRWTPRGLRALTNQITLKTNDQQFDSAGQIAALFMPLMPGEKIMIPGQMDVRTNHVYTNVYLDLGEVLYRTGVAIDDTDGDGRTEAWKVTSPSELLPASGLIQAVVEHQQIVPKSIRTGSS